MRGRWIGVALIEDHDDQHLVVGGRELDKQDAADLRWLLEQGGSDG